MVLASDDIAVPLHTFDANRKAVHEGKRFRVFRERVNAPDKPKLESRTIQEDVNVIAAPTTSSLQRKRSQRLKPT